MTRLWHWELDHPYGGLLPLPVVRVILGLAVTGSIPRNGGALTIYALCVVGYTIGTARVLHIHRRQLDRQGLV